MNCLTGNDIDGNPVKLEVQGQSENVPHKRLEFFYKPCNPVSIVSGTDQSNVKCLIDSDQENAYQNKIEEIKLYVGDPNLLIVYNSQKVVSG